MSQAGLQTLGRELDFSENLNHFHGLYGNAFRHSVFVFYLNPISRNSYDGSLFTDIQVAHLLSSLLVEYGLI